MSTTILSSSVEGRIFRLPLLVRKVNEKGPLERQFLTCVGGTGKFFHYADPLELDPLNVGRFAGSVICDSYCYVEAPDALTAIQRFHQEWDGAKIGGSKRTEKALWINERDKIIEYPFCRRIHRNPKGRYICGRMEPESDDLDGTGEFGGCVLDQLDPLDDCPIADFLGVDSDRKRHDFIKYEEITYEIISSGQCSLCDFQ